MKRPCCAPMAKLRSNGAVLVIVWTFLVFAAFGTTFSTAVSLSYPVAQSCVLVVIALLGPLAGLVSSIYFGRYRSLYGSFGLMWGSSTCIGAVLVLQEFSVDSQHLVFHIGLYLALVVFSAGFVVVLVNLIPFGVDQMPDASAEQIKAFVSRFAWSALAGVVTGSLTHNIRGCTGLQFTTLPSLLCAIYISVLLCTTFLCTRWLVVEPEDTNPLKQVYHILVFAAKHKYPVRRSAFTYCENEQPSRIDLAKSKYGGPFTSEEVESVKTFFRMSLVIATVVVIITPGMSSYLYVRYCFHAIYFPLHSCLYRIVGSASNLVLLIVLSPPVVEVIIQQKLRNRISGILKCVALTQILSTFVALFLLVDSVVWHVSHSSAQLPLCDTYFIDNYVWIEIPVNFFSYVWLYITLLNLIEFVCAQAPYRQRGMLMGLMFSVVLVGGGCAASIVFPYFTGGPKSANSGVWLCLALLLSTILGSLIWSCVAKRYKNRERDEPDRSRVYVEEVYDRYCSLQTP